MKEFIGSTELADSSQVEPESALSLYLEKKQRFEHIMRDIRQHQLQSLLGFISGEKL